MLAACAKPVPPAPPVAEVRLSLEVSPDAPLGRHAGHDVCFPTAPPAPWAFTGARHYDNPAGLDVGWTYAHPDGTLLSLFVYPHHQAPPDGVSPAEAEARLHAREVADVVWSSAGEVANPLSGAPGFLLTGVQQKPIAPLLPPEMHADVARQLGLPSLDGVTRSFGTLVLVWSRDAWFVKVRVTWLDAERPAEDLVRSAIGWSALPCSLLRDAGAAVPIVDVPPGGLSPSR